MLTVIEKRLCELFYGWNHHLGDNTQPCQNEPTLAGFETFSILLINPLKNVPNSFEQPFGFKGFINKLGITGNNKNKNIERSVNIVTQC